LFSPDPNRLHKKPATKRVVKKAICSFTGYFPFPLFSSVSSIWRRTMRRSKLDG
jgi:hypothetical protein